MASQMVAHAEPALDGDALLVGEVIEIAREWVVVHGRQLAGFAGAYLWGGITALPVEALFPLYRDVDIVVVLTEGAREENLEVLYRGVMLEVISQNLDAHRDVEAVLADPSMAPNLATTQILADPTGILGPLQQAVAAAFDLRRWVQARCDAEREAAERHLAAMREATGPLEGRDHLWLLLNALSGLLAIASLERPTTRRTLTLLGELLEAQGRPELREAALELWGSARLSRAEVQAMLDLSLVAFDRSVEVYQTPTPFGFTIRAHLRPYLAGATQEMIDEGNHREATFWIMALASESYLVLHNDAPEWERPMFAAQWQAMNESLGYTKAGAWVERVAAAERLAEEIYLLADGLAGSHCE
jgi:hypothetical protein